MSITVVEETGGIICGLWDEDSHATRDIISLDNCGHIYHIKCIIKYAEKHRIECPKCKYKLNDIRLSIALAFKKNSLCELKECIGGS